MIWRWKSYSYRWASRFFLPVCPEWIIPSGGKEKVAFKMPKEKSNELPLNPMTTTSWREWEQDAPAGLGIKWPRMDHNKDGKPTGPDMSYGENLRTFLGAYGERYRLNRLTKDIEQWIATAPDKWERTKGYAPEITPMDIRERIKARLDIKVTADNVGAAVYYLANMDSYNPVLDYLNERRRAGWDGHDYIGDLFSHIVIADDAPADRDTYETMFKYALYQTYALAFNKGNISPQGCLVLQGPQGIGKTTLVQALAPREYVRTGAVIDPDNKDSVIINTSAWIVELGEAARTLKKVNALKAFLTSPFDYYRRPYGKDYIKAPRITSFYLTTNDDKFLLDDTGNRRFWPIPIKDITGLDEIRNYNPDGLWSQVAYIASEAEKDPEKCKNWWVMPPEIMQVINNSNDRYRVQGGAEMAIREYYDMSLKPGAPGSRPMTAMQVIDDISSHMDGVHGALNPVTVGRALSKMATRGEIEKIPAKNHMQPATYLMPPRRNERYDAAMATTTPPAADVKTYKPGDVIDFTDIIK